MQNIFITGASSGLGRAMAQYYARQGARLALIGRREDALQELANSLSGQHICYALDVRDHDALRRAAHDFIEHCNGKVDVVLACAGISVGTLTEHVEDIQVFKAVFDTNVLATVATFEPFIAAMRKRAAGRLVGISSVAAIRGLPGAGAYSASKAAVMTYCESLRVELARDGIDVITIAPGFIDTAMTRHNPYPMPFLMHADQFATRAAVAIERGVSYTVIPWQMGIVAKLLRLLPNAIYDKLLSNRARKPRSQP